MMTSKMFNMCVQLTLSGRPEDVTVHELPSELLLCVLAGVDLVVPGDVLVEGAEENHGNHSCKFERLGQFNCLTTFAFLVVPERNRTMTSELRMENHWMLVWGIDSRM